MKKKLKCIIVFTKPEYLLFFLFFFFLIYFQEGQRTVLSILGLILFTQIESTFRIRRDIKNQFNPIHNPILNAQLQHSKLIMEMSDQLTESRVHFMSGLFAQTKLIHDQGKTLSKSLNDSQVNLMSAILAQTKLIHDKSSESQKKINEVSTCLSNHTLNWEKWFIKFNDNHLTLLKQNRLNYFELESYISLVSVLQSNIPLPPMRHSAISPDFACILHTTLQEIKPDLVLELGSGISTLITALTLKNIGKGHLISIEENAIFAERTNAELALRGLTQYVTVVHAELSEQNLGNRETIWYALHRFESLLSHSKIDLLVVDGPDQSQSKTKQIRFGALPALQPFFSDDCIILLDDTNRQDESDILKEWTRLYPVIKFEMIYSEKGTAKIRFNEREAK